MKLPIWLKQYNILLLKSFTSSSKTNPLLLIVATITVSSFVIIHQGPGRLDELDIALRLRYLSSSLSFAVYDGHILSLSDD
jgi:hypothetical protein